MNSQVYISARGVPVLGFFELTVDEARELMDYICSDEMACSLCGMETTLRFTTSTNSITGDISKEFSIVIRFEVGEGSDSAEEDKEYLESLMARINSWIDSYYPLSFEDVW